MTDPRPAAPSTPRSPARLVLLAVLVASGACAGGRGTGAPSDAASAPPPPRLVGVAQRSGTTALLQAVSVVNDRIVWVSGHDATYARTTDGGATWHAARVPGADSLQFRDVYAVDADTAYLLSAGAGDRSRIYKTTDAGQTWSLQFTNHDPDAFFDCMDFWDARHGVAMSDAVNGRFPIIVTSDGGATWTPVPASALPAAGAGEGGFAASGTCVTARPPGDAWIATGNGSTPRVLHTGDRGRTWTASVTPIAGGPGAGLTSVAFRDGRHGVVVGGPIGAPRTWSDNVAITADGGATWTLGGRPPFPGAIYGAVYVPHARTPMLVAVGPGGAAVSHDDGRTWAALDTVAYWSVGFASPSAGWAVGPRGRITKFHAP